MGRGVPPQPTRGERRKLPQRGPGQSPGRKRVLVYLELEKNTHDSNKSVIYDISVAYIYSQLLN